MTKKSINQAKCKLWASVHPVRLSRKSVHLISTYSINTWSLTIKGSSQFQPVMDGLVGGTDGGDVELQSGAPLGLLSMAYFLKHLPPGYQSSSDHRSRQMDRWSLPRGLRRTTPFEVFITVFCHYMIKVIAGRVSTL
ncbi:hypothetical protein NQZ68_034282 [Dissostichus eleginoides]|nr:hypothetical protein NQZ68_034282 [Dissostichus eleginoides]